MGVKNPWTHRNEILHDGKAPWRSYSCKVRWWSVWPFSCGGGRISGFPIDFDSRPYNTLALPCQSVIIIIIKSYKKYKYKRWHQTLTMILLLPLSLLLMVHIFNICYCNNRCSIKHDVITVRDDISRDGTVLAILCGSASSHTASNIPTMLSTGHSALLEFVSDAVDQRQGFSADFEFVLPADTDVRVTQTAHYARPIKPSSSVLGNYASQLTFAKVNTVIFDSPRDHFRVPANELN